MTRLSALSGRVAALLRNVPLFAELARNAGARPAAALCDELLAALAAHQCDAPQGDDITLLAIRAL